MDVVKTIKYKLIIVNEVDLVKELESQAAIGFEVVEVLGSKSPDAYSNDHSWKVLLRKNG